MNTLPWRNATPDERIFWDVAKTKIAYNTITPLYFAGVIAANEFTVYAATKIYVGLYFLAGGGGAVMSATMGNVTFYDQANAVMLSDGNNAISATNYQCNQLVLKNIWFSRIFVQKHLHMIFSGYRLNV